MTLSKRGPKCIPLSRCHCWAVQLGLLLPKVRRMASTKGWFATLQGCAMAILWRRRLLTLSTSASWSVVSSKGVSGGLLTGGRTTAFCSTTAAFWTIGAPRVSVDRKAAPLNQPKVNPLRKTAPGFNSRIEHENTCYRVFMSSSKKLVHMLIRYTVRELKLLSLFQYLCLAVRTK